MKIKYPKHKLRPNGKYTARMSIGYSISVNIGTFNSIDEADMEYKIISDEWFGVGMWGWDNLKHPLYTTWRGMMGRCYYKKDKCYYLYGARGIRVCNRWLPETAYNFKLFTKDMGNRPLGYSLDRIDNEKGYSPENCKWSSDIEQSNNRRPKGSGLVYRTKD